MSLCCLTCKRLRTILVDAGFRYQDYWPQFLDYVSESGTLSQMQWARERNRGWSDVACEHLITRRNLETFTWAHANGLRTRSIKMLKLAIRAKNLEMVKWIWKNGGECRSGDVIHTVVYTGHIPILEWFKNRLEEVGTYYKSSDCETVAYSGNLSALQWLHAQGVPMPSNVIKFAWIEGDAKMARWAYENGAPLPDRWTEEDLD